MVQKIDYRSFQWGQTLTSSGPEHPGSVSNLGQTVWIPRVRDVASNPRWRERIKRGEDLVTGFSSDAYTYKAEPGGGSVSFIRYNPGLGRYEPAFTEVYSGLSEGHRNVPSHLPGNSDEADGKALISIYKKIRDESSHMNGLLFLGELGESLRMIRRPASAIRKGLERYLGDVRRAHRGYVRRPTPRRLREATDVITGSWLEMAYGWKPLLSDTKDIAETIARASLGGKRHSRARSYYETSPSVQAGPYNGVGTNNFGYPWATTPIHWQYLTTVRGVQYVVGLEMKSAPCDSYAGRLAELAGFTAENFIPTVYNLIPYSFVLDYFSNVGNVILAASTNTSSVKWISKTTREVTRQVTSSKLTWQDEPGFVGSGGGSAGFSQLERRTVARVRQFSLGIPDIQFNSLSRENDAMKIVNLGALLGQAFSSIRF